MEKTIYSKPRNQKDELLNRLTTGVCVTEDEGNVVAIEFFDGLNFKPLQVNPFDLKIYFAEGEEAGRKDARDEKSKDLSQNPYTTPKKSKAWAEGYNSGYDNYTPAGNFIDLDLPSGIKWCEYNLGVNPNDVDTKEKWEGYLFAWGETKVKDRYNHSTYKYCEIHQDSPSDYGVAIWTKYNNSDRKTVLEDSDNAVKEHLGSNYDMPTLSDWIELKNNTNVETVSNYKGINGLNGYKFTSKIDSSKFIFIETEDSVYAKGSIVGGSGNFKYDALWAKDAYSQELGYYMSLRYGGSMGGVSIDETSRPSGLKIRPIQRP